MHGEHPALESPWVLVVQGFRRIDVPVGIRDVASLDLCILFVVVAS